MKYIVRIVLNCFLILFPLTVHGQCTLEKIDQLIVEAPTAKKDYIELERYLLQRASQDYSKVDNLSLKNRLLKAKIELNVEKHLKFILFKACQNCDLAFTIIEFNDQDDIVGLQIWVADLDLNDLECKAIIAHEICHSLYDSLRFYQIEKSNCPPHIKNFLRAQIELEVDEKAIGVMPEYLKGLRYSIKKHDPNSYLSRKRLEYFKDR
jgi:hypothetical protein